MCFCRGTKAWITAWKKCVSRVWSHACSQEVTACFALKCAIFCFTPRVPPPCSNNHQCLPFHLNTNINTNRVMFLLFNLQCRRNCSALRKYTNATQIVGIYHVLKLLPSGMWCHVDWWIVLNISEENVTCCFKIEFRILPEDGNTTFLLYVNKYLLTHTTSEARKQ
jgi:hypothetical protein